MKMKKQRTSRLVPKLRFPRFCKSGSWDLFKLSEVASKITQGGTPDTSNPEYWNGNIPWITPAEMSDDSENHYTKTTVRSITKKGLINSSAELFPVNSVIISSRAPIGYVTINQVNMAINQSCTCIVPNEKIYHEFLYYSLLLASQRLNDLGEGAGIRGFTTSKIKNFSIPVPGYLEQVDIADCLVSLDNLINAETQKLRSLQDHKTGLLQLLIPASGKTKPRRRFPEFSNAKPWSMSPIEDISKKISQGGTPKTSVQKYWDGSIPWITPAEMSNDAVHHYTKNTVRTITISGLENCAATLIPPNSVIISNRAPIGYLTVNKTKMATNQGCKGIVPNSKIYYEFLYFSLLAAGQALNDLGAGSGFKEISMATLKAFEIPVPEYNEQVKIANCLKSLDDLIRLEDSKLSMLKEKKASLMQELFPKMAG